MSFQVACQTEIERDAVRASCLTAQPLISGIALSYECVVTMHLSGRRREGEVKSEFLWFLRTNIRPFEATCCRCCHSSERARIVRLILYHLPSAAAEVRATGPEICLQACGRLELTAYLHTQYANEQTHPLNASYLLLLLLMRLIVWWPAERRAHSVRVSQGESKHQP